MLKGKSRIETIENYLIAIVLAGAVMLSAGIGLSVLSPKGLPAILAMLGSFITFTSTIILILLWLMKEFKGE
jgi:ABC-type multidrug transport system permease subunit